MQAQFATLAKTMEAARSGPVVTDNAAAYSKQLQQVQQLRPALNQLMQATNGFTVETVKSVTASQALTKSIMDGKMNVSGAIKNFTQFKQTLREVANEQAALSKATAVQWTNSSTGKSMVDVFMPTNELATARQRMGVYLNALKAGSQSIQDWGKNTQWAGRQITAGFTMPLALAAAGLVVLAKTADQQLTRITKVMNTQTVSDDPFVQQQSNLKQYAAARDNAMQNGIQMARQYGAALNDTLGLEADLAALGKGGNDLTQTTAQVTRFATLGELDYNTALQTTISLMNAYKMSTGDLTDAFNYMNALENNTALSMQDFAKAIPVASNAMAQLGVSFQQFGTLMVAGEAGGVSAQQMANALKSATGRILAPSKATIEAFKELNVDITQEVKDSGANLMDLLDSLGKKMEGSDPLKRMTAIKDLFGTYQYGKVSTVISNILDASANPDDPNNQTATAMKTAKQDPAQWAAIADQEIQQFQQSASGKLKIAVASLKAQLTDLGTPILGMVTPVVHGLTSIITIVQKIGEALPDPVKKFGAFAAIGAALLGPFGMIVGIGANAVGTIGKILAAMGLWTNGTKMQTKEQAAQNALMRETLEATTTAANSTGDLAAKMQDVITIMEERIAAQETLNTLTAEGAKIEAEHAAATGENAQAVQSTVTATNEATTAEGAQATAGELSIKAIRDQIIAWRELGAAERQAAADAASAAGAAVTGITGARIGTGGFAVNSSGRTTYSANGSRAASLSGMMDQNGYDASLGYGVPTSAANGSMGRGFTFGTNPVRNGLVGLRGPSGTQNAAIQAANWRRMLDAGLLSEQARNAANPSSIAANYNSLVNRVPSARDVRMSQGVSQLSQNSINLGPASALASSNVIKGVQRELMDDLVRMSETPVTSSIPGARARLAAVATKLNPFNGIKSGNPSGFIGPQLPQAGEMGFIGPMTLEQQKASDKAAANAQRIAEQSERTGASWGKIAGNMTGLAIGGMMIKDMAEGSSSLAANILQATLAFGMLAPVGVQIGGVFKKLVGSAASVGAEGAAGASVMSAGFSKAWGGVKSGLEKLKGAAVWLFTTGPGIFLASLAAIGIAMYAIHEQMTKLSRQQEQINESTTTWQKILGYNATSQMTALSGSNSGGNITAFAARASAVKQLTSANKGLGDSLADAAKKQDHFNSVFSLATTEALKVKVDGGTAQQAKMAFDVALQAAGLNQAEIDKLDVRFKSVNLDDPNAVANALMDQVAQALNNIKPADIKSGFWARTFLGGTSLTDEARAAAENAANLFYQALRSAAGNPSEVKSVTDRFKGQINGEFSGIFASISKSGGNAALFKKAGISSMDELYSAVEGAMNTSSSKRTKLQKQLIASVFDTGHSNDFHAYADSFKSMLDTIGSQMGLKGKDLDVWESKIMSIGGLTKALGADSSGAASGVKALGDSFQQAADGAQSLADAMNTEGAIATGAQYAQEMQQAYGGTISKYTQQVSEAFQKQQQAASDAIQAGGDKKVKALQASEKKQDAVYDQSDKNITAHYKNLSDLYDSNIKAKQDEATAETDAIQKQMDALKKEDTTRQDLFNAEKTRLERMAQMQSNNIDFNAALNSGNLDEAARVYANNQSKVQGDMLDDQQTAMDKVSQAAQDALQRKIDGINSERDTYVQAQQTMKDALSDRESAEHEALTKQKQAYDDAMQAQIDSTNKATQNSITMSNNRYQKDKEAIDLQIAAITAFVPQSVGQVQAQITQINGAYGGYGKQLQLYGKAWGDTVGSDLQLSILEASNAIQSQVGWSQMGTFIQNQIDQGAAFTLDQALTFLKTGNWPKGIGGSQSNAEGVKPWSPNPAYVNGLKEAGLGVNTKYTLPGTPRASHSGGLAGSGPEGLNFKNRVGVSPSAPMMPSEYLTLLRDGEFVVNKQATEQNRGLLESINNGDFIARHSGGFIGGDLLGKNIVLHAGLMASAAKMAVTEAYGHSQVDQMYNGAGLGADVSRFLGKGNSISSTLEFAKSQQGKPYIWGGTGPGGQDCSGFMSVLYNFLAGSSPKGNSFPWGRDWTTGSFEGGREFGPWKRDSRSSGHKFRIGVLPNSHMAGTLGGYNVESGSGHGPMVGGKSLGADNKMFPYQYYLPMADLPQLNKGGIVQYDNTLANLHKDEAVLTKPLTDNLINNVANGGRASYNVENLNVYGPVNGQVDFEKGVYNALVKLDDKNGRSRTVS